MKDDDYLSLAITGELTRDALTSARNDAIPMLATHRCNKVFVDATRGNPRLSLAEHFDFTSEHPSVFPRDARIALLVRPEVLEEHKLAEDVAVNRGLSMYVFSDKAEALEWLIGKGRL